MQKKNYNDSKKVEINPCQYNISEFLKIRDLVYKDFLGATIYAFMDR